MARFEDALKALNPYRLQLQHATFADIERLPATTAGAMSAFSASPAFATPLTNVHATGVGIRVKDGKVVKDEFVIKAFVFEKVDLGDAAPPLTTSFEGIKVDVEVLPVQLAAGRKAQRTRRASAGAAGAGGPPNRNRVRPIPGGVSIAPLNARYIGTLGCFVKGVAAGAEQVFALSNNHVLANVNSLPVGTPICQPGPESVPTTPADVFASLTNFIPIQFPDVRFQRRVNLFDAAIARVSDQNLIKFGAIFGIPNYSARLGAAVPGMQVTKSGRTTGVTTGVVTAIHVNSVQINYGNQANPRIAVFDDTIQIRGDAGAPFSLPGDSGSVILERSTGDAVALLFAGDGRTTTACDLGGVCRQFQVIPT
jgi:hypothetical protein